VARLYADELRLVDPGSPWQTNRVPVARLGAALDVAAGALAKIGTDVVLLAAFGEVRERDAGGSSTMPQKQNPVGATLARACALQVHGHAGVLTAAAAAGELERPAGAWHAEWDALSGALALTGAAAAAIRGALDGLEVDAARMRANIPPDVLAEARRFGLEPAAPDEYLGSAGTFVDRVLASYEAAGR
jgi:3-carboxy-cis,cis-muconate cycloisomerase